MVKIAKHTDEPTPFFDNVVKLSIAMTPVMLALITVLQFWITKRQDENHLVQVEVAKKIESLEHNTNTKMDLLLEVTGREKKAEGVLEGKAETKDKEKP